MVAVTLVVLVVAGAALWSAEGRTATADPVTTRDVRLDVLDGPRKQHRVQIDLRLYAPSKTPAPAVVLAHGFDGDKNSLAGPAWQLAQRGFTVLTYSSRGFGDSTGKIALNSPAYEVTDARQILDWLARQPEVVSDGEGDPLVGVAGVSYGGALSLLLAGSDQRVDAIAPMMAYNDLTQALLPNAASTTPVPSTTAARGAFAGNGVFKQAWASLLFATGTRAPARTDEADRPAPTSLPATPTVAPSPAPPSPEQRRHTVQAPNTLRAPTNTLAAPLRPGAAATPPATDEADPATCGNFTAHLCAAYTELAQTGHASPETLALLNRASPSSVTDNITVPTLLVQSQNDPLFGLPQADANARQIAAAGGRAKMIWYVGGRDGVSTSPRLWDRVGDWFGYHLNERGGPPVPNPGTSFEYQVVGERERDSEPNVRTVVAPDYPGVHANRARRVPLELHGAPTRIINPPGGGTMPAELATGSEQTAGTTTSTDPVSDSPAGSGVDSTTDLPGSVVRFRTDPVRESLRVTGVSQTRLSVSTVPSQPTTPEAVLFAKLYDVGPDGSRTLIGNRVSPMRITDLPADGTPVTVEVTLPGTVHVLEQGHRLELAVSSTNPAYSTPTEPAVHLVGLAGEQSLSVPSVHGEVVTDSSVPKPALVGLGVIAVLAVVAWAVTAIVRRHGGPLPDPNLRDTPLEVTDASKTYPGGLRALNGLSLRVERGQIVGLLGPNGAGKTTTLRMITGLVRPTSGEIRLFGHQVRPGVSELTRVGFCAEGAGLLPHLSGLDNLRTYWEATGRPAAQARFDEVLEVAGLGEAADRRVSTYAPGMRQRLGIARAMLGMPDLLVLDEPTLGMDPQRSHEIREILRDYAASGRAVLLSSHLLTEVEQLCSHVVIIGDGETRASGTVEEILATRSGTTFGVDQPEVAAEALRALAGIGPVEVDGSLVHADLAAHPVGIAVNALVAEGVSVHEVRARHGLEDAFLELVGEENR